MKKKLTFLLICPLGAWGLKALADMSAKNVSFNFGRLPKLIILWNRFHAESCLAVHKNTLQLDILNLLTHVLCLNYVQTNMFANLNGYL